jgi:hypothetical protein
MESKNLIKLSSILIFIFSLFINIYDMIVHDRLRMLCRSIGHSRMLAISWIFIVMTIIIIVSQNKAFNYKTLSLIFVCYVLLTISATLDYNNRLKTNKNIWKKIHYILSIIMMITLLYGVYILRSDYIIFILITFILFLFCHTSKDFIIREKISIVLELILIYTSMLVILVKTNQNIDLNNNHV